MNAISRACLVSVVNRSLVQTFIRRCVLHNGHLRVNCLPSLHCKLFSSSVNNQPLKVKHPATNRNVLCNQERGITADNKTTAVTIWEDLKQIRFSPIPALALGFSGLIPFIAPPAYMIFNQIFSSQLVFAETAYGACILSFLGGVRWGFVIPEESECQADWFNLGYSVAPSLVAWTALMLPQPVSILVVIGGIAGSAYFDTAVKGYPPWFKGLRFTLSLGAVLSLWTVFLCQYMLSSPADQQLKAEEKSEKV